MHPKKPIRILVVDDHFMVRMGLSASLNIEPDMEVVAEAGTGEEALGAYRQHKPSLVIMDLRMPGMSGAESIAAIVREHPSARILVLSTHSGEEDIYRAIQAGAQGYIPKSAVRDELLRAIREVHAGRTFVDSAAALSLVQRTSRPGLTGRELEVLRLVVKGLSNKEIASLLNLAEITVKVHVHHLFEKLQVSDRTQAATIAIQRGIVVLD